MNERYSIGELATAAGVPSTTIRYYERAGLLQPEGRTHGNYRYYSRRSLKQLQFIRSALAGGFTIENVRALLELRECKNPCQEVQKLIEHRISEVSTRMKELRRVQRELKGSLVRCQSAEESHCEVLTELQVTKPKRASAKKRREGA